MESEKQQIEIVTGTYEELLLGYKLFADNGEYSLEQSFTDHSHTGCVKSVDISRKGVLASGGTDEIIRLFNLRKRSELGSLMEHEGAVTCVQFYGGSHLFTASDDKTVCIWKTFTWECLKTLKGHKAGVNCVSIHPSGKLALSVGQDRCMQTWNLVRGRSAYTTNIKEVADLVVWSTSGDSYIIVINNSLDVYNTETASIHCTIKSEGRVNALLFLQNEIIAYGGDGGDIFLHDIRQNKQLSCIKTNTVRIRGLVCTRSPYNSNKLLMVSASSDGFIKVFELNTIEGEVDSELLTEHNTKFRLTCVAMTPFRDVKQDFSNMAGSEKKVVKVEDQSGSESDGEMEQISSPKSKKGESKEKSLKRKKRKQKQNFNTEQDHVEISKPCSAKKKKKRVAFKSSKQM